MGIEHDSTVLDKVCKERTGRIESIIRSNHTQTLDKIDTLDQSLGKVVKILMGNGAYGLCAKVEANRTGLEELKADKRSVLVFIWKVLPTIVTFLLAVGAFMYASGIRPW